MNTRFKITFVLWFLIAYIAAPVRGQFSEMGASIEDRNCGAKCLYVILRGYGEAPDTYKMIAKELGPATMDGYSLLELRDVARKHDLFAESAHFSKEDLRQIGNSCSIILHLNKVRGKDRSHYVICEGITSTTAIIFDASSGIPAKMSHEIFSLWSGNALVISKKPIELLGKPKSIFWIGYLAWSILFTFCLLGLLMLSRFLSLRLLWRAPVLVVVLTQVGCTSKNEESVQAEKLETTKSVSATPPTGSGVWVDRTDYQLGTLRREPAPKVVTVKIYNSEKEQRTLKDIHFTCGCLIARFSSLTIAPESSIDCDLELVRSQIGLRQSTATLRTDKNERISFNVSWNVVASMTSEPEVLNGIEMKCGDIAKATIHLTQLESFDFSRLEVQSHLGDKDNSRFFSADAKIVGEVCKATFKTNADSPTGLVRGNFEIGIPGSDTVSIKVPFTVYVANQIDIFPEIVYFTQRDETLHAQVLVFSNDGSSTDPIRLTWIGKKRTECKCTILDQQDTQVVDLAISPDAVEGIQQIEVSVANGKYVKILPVFFP